MRKTFIALCLSCLSFAIFSCKNDFGDKLFGERIYKEQDRYWLLHKTSDCKAIKNGIEPKDTSALYWENDYYYDGVPVMFCSKCLSDDEIRYYDALRRSQRQRIHQEPVYTPAAAVDTTAW